MRIWQRKLTIFHLISHLGFCLVCIVLYFQQTVLLPVPASLQSALGHQTVPWEHQNVSVKWTKSRNMNCKAGLWFLTRTFGVCCYFNVSNSTHNLLFSTIAFTKQKLQTVSGHWRAKFLSCSFCIFTFNVLETSWCLWYVSLIVTVW